MHIRKAGKKTWTALGLEFWCCCVLAMMSLCGSSLLAQGLGSVAGTVKDATGAVIVGADVEVMNQGTKFTRETKTDDQGYFVIPSLNPAAYAVTARAHGSAVFSPNDITLLADQSLSANPALSLKGQIQPVPNASGRRSPVSFGGTEIYIGFARQRR